MSTTRRGFIKQTGLAAAAGAAPWLANLAAISEACAALAPTTDDYKALVCIFLPGGNDHVNTIVPFDDTSYATMKDLRPQLCYDRTSPLVGSRDLSKLDAAIPALGDNTIPVADRKLWIGSDKLNTSQSFALAPPLYSLKKVWDNSRLAVILNIGPLVEPTSGLLDNNSNVSLVKALNLSAPARLPPRLGSHNDQALVWLSNNPEGTTKGWGGRIADQTRAGNTKPVFSAISLVGNTTFLTGQSVISYQVSASKTMSVPLVPLRAAAYGSSAVSTLLGQLVTGTGAAASTHLFERDLSTLMQRAISSDDVLRAFPITPSDPNYASFKTAGGADKSYLCQELRTVAHLIANRSKTGAKRQVFYVEIGGFIDPHDGLINKHPDALYQLGEAMAAFDQALTELGVSKNVTTFTASEFGRTFNSNNDGTDHGWGGHHMVMGGAVQGKKIYGAAPAFGDKAKRTGESLVHDTGRGRLIPTTSVDQLAEQFARWMGVTDTATLNAMLPNLPNFQAAAWPHKDNLKGLLG